MMPKNKNYRSEKYKAFIREHRCLACRVDFGIQVHHISLGNDRGIAIKPPDTQCIPLCQKCHHLCHQYGQNSFFADKNVDYHRAVVLLQTEYIKKLEEM